MCPRPPFLNTHLLILHSYQLPHRLYPLVSVYFLLGGVVALECATLVIATTFAPFFLQHIASNSTPDMHCVPEFDAINTTSPFPEYDKAHTKSLHIPIAFRI